MAKKAYWYKSNWNGSIKEFDKIRDCIKSIKTTEMNSVTIYSGKTGEIVRTVEGGRYYA